MRKAAAVFLVLCSGCGLPGSSAESDVTTPPGSSEALVEFRDAVEVSATAAAPLGFGEIASPGLDPVKVWFLRTQIGVKDNPELWQLIGPKAIGR